MRFSIKLFLVAAALWSCSAKKEPIAVADRAALNEERKEEVKPVLKEELVVALPKHNFVRDTSLSALEKAVVIDSIWLDILYDRELDLVAHFADEDFDDSAVEQSVNTEDLKKRLEQINAETPFHLSYNPALVSTRYPPI